MQIYSPPLLFASLRRNGVTVEFCIGTVHTGTWICSRNGHCFRRHLGQTSANQTLTTLRNGLLNLQSVFHTDCGQLRTDMLISLINEVWMAGILVFTPLGILILPHLYYVNGLCQKHKHKGGAVKREREGIRQQWGGG